LAPARHDSHSFTLMRPSSHTIHTPTPNSVPDSIDAPRVRLCGESIGAARKGPPCRVAGDCPGALGGDHTGGY
jgi:hypothetical protein